MFLKYQIKEIPSLSRSILIDSGEWNFKNTFITQTWYNRQKNI